MFSWLVRRRKQPEHLRVGEWGEELAARMLRRKGLRILGRRVRVGEHDELDIVAKDDGVLVFVEVKTRKSEDFGAPATAVNRKKRARLSRAAMGYLHKRKFPEVCFRFDVVEVIGRLDDPDATVRHIENAFPLDSRYKTPY